MTHPYRGITTWHYPCPWEQSDLVRERLRAFRFVNLDACSYSGGALHVQVDLALLGHGDGPAAKLMLFRDLDLVRSRHRLPSSHPPPPDEAA